MSTDSRPARTSLYYVVLACILILVAGRVRAGRDTESTPRPVHEEDITAAAQQAAVEQYLARSRRMGLLLVLAVVSPLLISLLWQVIQLLR